MTENNMNLPHQDVKLEEFVAEESNTVDHQFKMIFSNGKVMKVCLHE